MKRCLSALLCLGLLVGPLPRAAAVAQDLPPMRPRDVRAACAGDYFRFCRDVLPGGGRVILCMNMHADKLSPRCFQAMTAWGLATASALKACLPDAERLCGHLPPGGGRSMTCLMQNADRLSPPCRDALSGQDFFDAPPEPRRGGR